MIKPCNIMSLAIVYSPDELLSQLTLWRVLIVSALYSVAVAFFLLALSFTEQLPAKKWTLWTQSISTSSLQKEQLHFRSSLLLHISPSVELWQFTVALLLSVAVPSETSLYKHSVAVLCKHILFCFPALQQYVHGQL